MSPLGRISNGLGGDPYDSAIWLPCSAFASTPFKATHVPTPQKSLHAQRSQLGPEQRILYLIVLYEFLSPFSFSELTFQKKFHPAVIA